jgi:hypothetical protein
MFYLLAIIITIKVQQFFLIPVRGSSRHGSFTDRTNCGFRDVKNTKVWSAFPVYLKKVFMLFSHLQDTLLENDKLSLTCIW